MDGNRHSVVSVNNLLETFCWRVGILDDFPESPAVCLYKATLTGLGIQTVTYGGSESAPERLGFFRDPKARAYLKCCHLFLVDMQWLNLSDPQALLAPPDLWASDDDQRLVDFADLFESGSSTTSTPLSQRHIKDDMKGLWIAAALSHLNPNARIVFFSGEPSVIQGAEAGAFMQFKTRPVQILEKETDVNREVIEQIFEYQLGVLQKQALQTFEDAYRWFVSSVMLSALFGQVPPEDICGPLHPNDPIDISWIIRVESFFPQWQRWQAAGKVLEHLKQFLRSEPFRLSVAQKRALASVSHLLRRAIRNNLGDSSLSNAEHVAYEIGPPGWSVLKFIIEAQQLRSLDRTRDALSLCNRVKDSSSSQLWDLVEAFRSEYDSDSAYECDHDVEAKPYLRTSESVPDENDPPLPFDTEHLRRACEALIDNAKKYPPASGERLKIALRVRDTKQHLEITYTDNSKGFSCLDEPSSAVNRSLSDNRIDGGMDRGIPLALSFGLHFPLASLQVKWNNGDWLQLYPVQQQRGLGTSCGFGVRWIFPY